MVEKSGGNGNFQLSEQFPFFIKTAPILIKTVPFLIEAVPVVVIFTSVWFPKMKRGLFF